MIEQLLLNSCWNYKCVISSQIYDILTFNDTLNGIFAWFLWLQLPLSIYGFSNLIHKIYRKREV